LKNTNTLSLKSSSFGDNENIPSIYTCDGYGINPPLKIENIPEGTKSLVLIMDDPDVPKYLREDGMWDHWIKFNIPPTTVVINEGEEPEGISGKGTSNNFSYYGPCPPDKKHRYFFKLYALDIELDLVEGVSKKRVEQAMKEHILDKTQLIGLYEKQTK
jgi:Raf kinase inhibitor-like YbhB/YbcL family protein